MAYVDQIAEIHNSIRRARQTGCGLGAGSHISDECISGPYPASSAKKLIETKTMTNPATPPTRAPMIAAMAETLGLCP